MPTATKPKFEHLGSLITYNDDQCLGYLVNFRTQGVYDATLGRVDIDPKYVEPHNQALDKALLDGLDNNCGIGLGGTFYLNARDTRIPVVKTFMGELVSDDTEVRGRDLIFRRNGMEFRGRIRKSDDMFNFKRTS